MASPARLANPPSLESLYQRFGGVQSDDPMSVTVEEYTELVLTMSRTIGPYNIILGPHGGVLLMGNEILPAGA